MKEQGQIVVCVKCRHYRVTWQSAHPYGCVAHGFKSRKNPALVVFESSGMRCQLFEAKVDHQGTSTPKQNF